MTRGEELKQRLGLETLPRVYMARILGAGPQPTYVVAYDSRNPEAPITSSLFRGPRAPFLARYPFAHRLKVLPFVPIERFRFEPVGAVLLVVDTAGRFADLNKTTGVLESAGDLTAFRLDEATLYDLKRTDNRMSALTRRYRKKRNQALGPENRLAKLVDVLVSGRDDSVTFIFSTPATKLPAMQTYPGDGYSMHRNPRGRYTLAIKILRFFSWLHTAPEGAVIKAQDIKDVLQVADVQLSSTDPSFYWQGFAWTLTQMDAAIYPVNIPSEVWAPRHFYSLLPKHLGGLINSIDFFLPFIANALTKKLRDLGHVPRPVRQRRGR